MPAVTTRSTDPTAAADVSTLAPAPRSTLHLALDLGNSRWQLAFATTIALAPRLRTVAARDLATLEAEIAAAKTRFGLPADAPVVTCYEAGRDGFWLHRALTARGHDNVVVDSASIGQNRRATDESHRLEATALVPLLRHPAATGGLDVLPSTHREGTSGPAPRSFTLTPSARANQPHQGLPPARWCCRDPRPARAPPGVGPTAAAPTESRARRSGRGCTIQ